MLSRTMSFWLISVKRFGGGYLLLSDCVSLLIFTVDDRAYIFPVKMYCLFHSVDVANMAENFLLHIDNMLILSRITKHVYTVLNYLHWSRIDNPNVLVQ